MVCWEPSWEPMSPGTARHQATVIAGSRHAGRHLAPSSDGTGPGWHAGRLRPLGRVLPGHSAEGDGVGQGVAAAHIDVTQHAAGALARGEQSADRYRRAVEYLSVTVDA